MAWRIFGDKAVEESRESDFTRETGRSKDTEPSYLSYSDQGKDRYPEPPPPPPPPASDPWNNQ